jgi:translocation and assembly module TamB
VSIHAQGLPSSPTSQLGLRGVLDGASLDLAVATKQQANGTIDLSIERARWKSAEVRGGAVVDANWRMQRGDIKVRMTRLADLRKLLDSDVAGQLEGTVALTEMQGRAQAHFTMTATDLAVSGNTVGHAVVDGTLGETAGKPNVTAHVTASDLSASGVTGNVTLDVGGSTDTLGLNLTADVRHADIAAQVRAEASLDVPHRRLGLTALQAQYCGETARLLIPARLDFADGVAVDHLQIGVRQAILDVAGRFSPRLEVSASLRNVTRSLAPQCLPVSLAHGAVAMEAKLSGTLAAPTGTFHITGRDARLQGGAAGTLAPADIDITGDLQDQTIRLDAAVKADKTLDVRMSGTIPMQPTGALNVKTSGTMDLAFLGPILMAGDRNVRGQVTVEATTTGSLGAPCVTGVAELTKGAVEDFSQGMEVHDVTARVEASCGTLHIVSLTAKAGPGTLSASGTIDMLADGMPIDLTILADNARPLASDLLTANLDANLSVRGQMAGPLLVTGTIHVRQADINIPENFVSEMAILDVRRRGQHRPAVPAPTVAVNLDLTLQASEQIFVRGHGIDAEMSGQIRVEGTNLAPEISGGFDLRRGTFSLAGKTLNFVSGRVGFDGAGVTHKIDPTLHLVAQSSASNITATLTVGGYADAPTIELSSVPTLPQDEILAQLIFGQSVKQLSPLQIAQIAQAVASLTNIGGGFDPLGAIRKGLGLDRLSAGADSSGSGASLQAGKYVANGVYVGAQGGLSGGTHAQVQIDLMDNLKLETTIGTGGSSGTTDATPENDPGSSVGLTYRLEY